MFVHILGLDSFPIFPIVIAILMVILYVFQQHTNSPDSETTLHFGNYPHYFDLNGEGIIDPKKTIVENEIVDKECPIQIKNGKISYKGTEYEIPLLYKVNEDSLLEMRKICDDEEELKPVNWTNLTIYYREKHHSSIPDKSVDTVLNNAIFSCKNGIATLIRY